MAFWDTQRKGANFFNNVELDERFRAARAAGIEVVRLAPNKWLNGRAARELGDFLLGRPGTFGPPEPRDVLRLRAVLDSAQRMRLKVVLTMLSLPGNRWSQHNGGDQQRAIWKDFEIQDKAVSFWRALARELRDHPALVGYNIKNEPSPERVRPPFEDWYTGSYSDWNRSVSGTPRDLNLFYAKSVAAIREVDRQTPVVLDSGFYATPWAFQVLQPVSDKRTLYSFHMYEPYAFTSRQNNGQYSYPGRIPIGERGDGMLPWNRGQIRHFLKPVRDWQEKHGIPDNRIFVGEFGVFRLNRGAAQYLQDLTEVFDGYGWHWAFYSFREDDWHGMDYEIGTGPPGAKYWEAIEQGRLPDYSDYEPNPLFQAITRALERRGSR